MFPNGADPILSNPFSKSLSGLSRLKDFLALSRTPHALLDLASPGLAALLSLGAFPSLPLLVMGLLTAFAGYTMVYALNDIVDYQVDRMNFRHQADGRTNKDLDSVWVRHPLAQGRISYGEALTWAIIWGTLAMIGAYLLNPFCLVIFLFAAALEIFYCRLLKITWLRSVVSGFVKTSGPVAAVFAVHPNPPLPFLLVLFLWFFFWEIGGQNIPNDLSDVEADRELLAKTIPVRFGIRASILVITISLIIAYGLSVVLIFQLQGKLNWVYLSGVVLSGLYFLFIPTKGLFLSQSTDKASDLFNRASYYPLALLVFLTISFLAG
jgi:4-hydroxybenzoate polyprenyltransferase